MVLSFCPKSLVCTPGKGNTIRLHSTEINPFDKSPEFLALNPRGLVPVIIGQDGKAVSESAVCIEYADELKIGDKFLLPKDPYQRARVRMWSDLISKKVMPTFYESLLRQEKSEQEDAKKAMLQHLAILSKEMDVEGPYFLGNDLGMVDIMLCPFTLRLFVLKHYRDFAVPNTQEYKRFHKWMSAVHANPNVVKTMADKQKLIDIYKQYADNTAKSQVAKAIQQGKPLP